MENFFQRLHGAIRQEPLRLNEKACHFLLPTVVYFTSSHPAARLFKIVSFEITNEQAIVSQEQ
jgi:hypothetical protein